MEAYSATHGPRFELLQRLLEVLAEVGIGREQLLAAPAVRAELEAADGRPPDESSQRRIVQAAAQLADDPSLALKVGQRIHIASFGTFGFALMSCVDLAEVVKLLVRYHPIVTTEHKLEYLQHDGGMLLRARPSAGNPEIRQPAMEMLFSSMCATGEFLIDAPMDSAELHFDYAAPAYARLYNELFSMPVRFRQEHCQLVLPETLLERRTRTGNPGGHVIYQQECEQLLRKLNREENVSAAVGRLLIQAGSEFPAIGQVAGRLHMSERTLRRRLRAESSSFRQICDEVRNMLACQYLEETEFTVAEIASLLNYSETVSFRRAFHRWNRMTPRDYRQLRRHSPSAGA